jgi:hypothetical protein
MFDSSFLILDLLSFYFVAFLGLDGLNYSKESYDSFAKLEKLFLF